VRLVIQRVKEARVDVDGDCAGRIGPGLLILVGVAPGDSEADMAWLARKVAGLRIFSDESGKMNLSVRDIGGACLAVSQFTLFADCRKGFRPGFSSAAPPQEGKEGFEHFVRLLQNEEVSVETGVFQADMQVHLINDGPVTIQLERSGSA